MRYRSALLYAACGVAVLCSFSSAEAQNATATTNPPAYQQQGSTSLSQTMTGGLRVAPMTGGQDVSQTNPLPVTAGSTSTPITPADISPSSNLTLVAGGTSQTLAAARACPNFIYINNASTTSGEGGIAAIEPIYVNITGAAATAGGGGSSIEIASGVIQPFVAQTTAITWIATTVGHKINVVCE